MVSNITMPFTFAHPAVVLPLIHIKKRWFSTTGLIIGSIVPDFEYFIRMDDKKIYTHQWSGLLYYDLPLSIILAYLLHNIVRNSFIDNGPEFLYKRLCNIKYFNWNRHLARRWLIVLASILIGAGSHLLWDAFTHKTGYFVTTIRLLQNEIGFMGWRIPIYKMLQYLSSYIGLIVLGYAIYRLPKTQKEKQVQPRLNYWINILFITTFVFILRLFLKIESPKELLVSIIASFLLSLIITPCLLSKKNQSKHDFSSSSRSVQD